MGTFKICRQCGGRWAFLFPGRICVACTVKNDRPKTPEEIREMIRAANEEYELRKLNEHAQKKNKKAS
jgi:hypothetical protein